MKTLAATAPTPGDAEALHEPTSPAAWRERSAVPPIARPSNGGDGGRASRSRSEFRSVAKRQLCGLWTRRLRPALVPAAR